MYIKQGDPIYPILTRFYNSFKCTKFLWKLNTLYEFQVLRKGLKVLLKITHSTCMQVRFA